MDTFLHIPHSVEVLVEDLDPLSWLDDIEDFVHRVLETQKIPQAHMTVMFCSEPIIQDLNARFRDRDEATDVLSFPLQEHVPGEPILAPIDGEPLMLGDIAMAPTWIEDQAEIFGVSFINELSRMLCHGVLHLLGHDHATKDPSEPMLILQEEILHEIGEIGSVRGCAGGRNS